MDKQKSPIYNLSRSKAQKHGKFRITDVRKAGELFSWYRTGVSFSFCNNFANFSKVFVLVESITPSFDQGNIDYTGILTSNVVTGANVKSRRATTKKLLVSVECLLTVN